VTNADHQQTNARLPRQDCFAHRSRLVQRRTSQQRETCHYYHRRHYGVAAADRQGDNSFLSTFGLSENYWKIFSWWKKFGGKYRIRGKNLHFGKNKISSIHNLLCRKIATSCRLTFVKPRQCKSSSFSSANVNIKKIILRRRKFMRFRLQSGEKVRMCYTDMHTFGDIHKASTISASRILIQIFLHLYFSLSRFINCNYISFILHASLL